MNGGKRRKQRVYGISGKVSKTGIAFALLAAAINPALAAKQVNCAYSNLQSELDAIKSGGTLEISGTCVGNFVVWKSVELRGKGMAPTLFGANAGTVLTVTGAATNVMLKNLTVTGGNNVASGGGILNYGLLTLTNSLVTGNHAVNYGGGIFNYGSVTLKQSLVTGNYVGLDGGGIYNDSSASGWGDLSLYDSSVSGNKSGASGGGIYSFGSTYLKNAVLNGNHAGTDGGGLKSAPGSTTTITGSAITGNVAASNGGVSGTITFKGKQSTISGNLPDGT
ncbi:MAG: hypothetical protein PHT19_08450 [Methylococcus sp.]|nr:hypothetical protein [Methylococcus sp.]